jgi:hypothetical protein
MKLAPAFASVFLLLAGCGGDDGPGGGSLDAGGTRDTGSMGPDSGTGDPDAGGAEDAGATGEDAGRETDAGSTTDAGAADAGSPGVACGARLGDTCAASQWCDFPDLNCDFADGTGICRPRPAVCDAIFDPVCGCDGMTYGNECTAQRMGRDISARGACSTDTNAGMGGR